METATRILFVRHGLVYNPENIIYGRLPDFRLSVIGERQAQAAGVALRTAPLAAIFTSPLLRAQQTAAHIAVHHPHLAPVISPWLNEIRIPLEGRPLAEAAARGWDLYTNSPPEYEQPEDIVARVRAFVAEIRRDYSGQTIVAVTHGDVIAFAVLWAAGRPATPAGKRTLDTIPGFDADYPHTASITTLTFNGANTHPIALTYLRPYGDDLLDDGAPK